MSWLIEKGQRLSIYVKDTENSAVKIAAQNLAMDLEKVMQIKAACENVSKESCSIVIHTLNQDNTMKWIENMLPTVDGVIRKEGYVCIVKDKKLYIAGADDSVK